MANISNEIAAFRNAVYGEDVRSALISLANTLNNTTTNAINTLTDAVSSAIQFKGSLGENYSSSVDVDTVIDRGIYYVGSPNSYINLPTTSPGLLFVEEQGSNIIIQKFMPLSNSNTYSRYKRLGSFGSWSCIKQRDTYKLKFLTMSESTANSTYNKICGDLPINTMCWIGPSWFDDLPSIDNSSWIFTISATDSSKVESDPSDTFAMQVIFNPTNGQRFYRKRNVSDGWNTDWQEIKPLLDSFQYINTNPDILTLDSIKDEGYYYSGTPRSRTIENIPTEFEKFPFLLLVKKINSIVWQHVYRFSSGKSYSRYYVNSSWTSWKCSDDKNHNSHYYAFGDSTTYGQIGGSGSLQSDNAYPFVIGRKLGMIVHNHGVKGQGLCKDWSTIQSDFISDLDMSNASLISVGWAYNDRTAWSKLNRGTYQSDDTTTVIGRYYTILKDFQEKCPSARVVLITGYGSPTAVDGQATLNDQFTSIYTFLDQTCTTGEVYDELEKMCNLRGFSCINQHKGTCFNKFNASTFIGDQIHPNDDGYLFYGQFLAAKMASLYANIV